MGLEVKTPAGDGRPEGKLSKLQEVTLAKINVAGGVAEVVRSVDEVKAIIESVRRSSG